ncbi:MAG: HAD-IA family hydrolase [Thiothrix sp.]|nr:HAD-IA family hydrolase [Thiothrix sp.]HPQ95710.1 HAD-IA family hydrolase [Thiolinea sp.]
MAIRCVAFDLDDTLWDCKAVIDHAEQQLYQWLQANHPVITRACSLQTLVAHRQDFAARHPGLHHDLGALRLAWLRTLAREHDQNDAMAGAAYEKFFIARNQVTFFPEVLETLNQLHGSYQLGVISNGNADVHHIGIGHFFHFVLNAAEAGTSKPDPAIFHQATARAGVHAHEMAYVGDDPEKDIIGACRAGLRTIWYNPQSREMAAAAEPDVVMTNFAELGRLLESL